MPALCAHPEVAGERKHQQNHIVPTKGGSLVTSHQGGISRRCRRARDTRGRERRNEVVDMGLPTAQQKTFQKQSADVNDFFPHGTTIHVGDSIRFVPTGFHTVDLPAKGGKPLGLFAPAGTTSGVVDAAGAAFWFNGQPMLGFNPVLGGASSARSSPTPAPSASSPGLPLSERPKPFTVRFTKTGTYTYYCNIHAGMKGTVRVRRQEPQGSFGQGRRQGAEGAGRVGPEDRQGPGQSHRRTRQRQPRRVGQAAAWSASRCSRRRRRSRWARR